MLHSKAFGRQPLLSFAMVGSSRASAFPARHLKGLDDEPTDSPAIFSLILSLATLLVVGSVLCFFRDIVRHKLYKNFKDHEGAKDLTLQGALRHQGNDGPAVTDSNSASLDQIHAFRASTIENHVEGLLGGALLLHLPSRLRFSRYLDSLQSISIVYGFVRCVLPLFKSRRSLVVLMEKSLPLSTAWLLYVTRIVNLLVSEAVLTYLFLVNPGVCSAASSKEACQRPLRLDGHRQLCNWNHGSNSCQFEAAAPGSTEDIGNDQLYYYLILAILSMMLSLPLNVACEWFINRYADLMRLHTVTHRPSRFSMPRRLVECTADAPAAAHRSPIKLTLKSESSNLPLRNNKTGIRAPPETLLRAVRLHKLRERIDEVGVPEEKYSIMNSLKRTGPHQVRMLKLLSLPVESASPNLLDDTVEALVAKARAHSNFSSTEIMPLLGPLSREMYLIRLFLYQSVDLGFKIERHRDQPLWNAVCASAAEIYLFGAPGTLILSSRSALIDPHAAILPRIRKAAGILLLLVAYMLGACALLLTFGIHVDTFHSDAWVSRFIVCYLIIILLLEPLKALTHDVSMSCIAQEKLRPLVENLISRTPFVLGRLSGQLDLDQCGVQHVMTACRVARAFPNLPISRLLLSMRDSDVVRVSQKSNSDEISCAAASNTTFKTAVRKTLSVLRSPVVNMMIQFLSAVAYVLSLLFGSVAGVIIVAIFLILWYLLTEIYIFISVGSQIKQLLQLLVSSICSIRCCDTVNTKYYELRSQSEAGTIDKIRSLSSDSYEGTNNVEITNLDTMELGYFSERQDSIRSDQKNRKDLLLHENKILRNPSLSTFGSRNMSTSASFSPNPGHLRNFSRSSSMDLHSEHSGQSGPIMLLRNESFSTSEDESSDDDENNSRGIDDLLTGIKKPATRSPCKKSTSSSPTGSLGKKSPKKGHYSPALSRLSSLRRSSNRGSIKSSSSNVDGDRGALIPDTSSIGDIRGNRWVRLKRTWSNGHCTTSSKETPGSRVYPVPYTLLEAINRSDLAVFEDKNYIFGHMTPSCESKRVARVLQGKVLSITSCSFDSNGSLWILHEEDDAWFFAFDMTTSNRGAVLGNNVTPSLVTVLSTELRPPLRFCSPSAEEEAPSYETLFTFQLIFIKGTAIELRRSFGALTDLNTSLENSLRVLKERDLEKPPSKSRLYKLFSTLPQELEGRLDLYEENQSKLTKFVTKVERWLVELLFFLDNDVYEDSNIPAMICNFFAPNNADVELMTNKILQMKAVATPPPSPSYIRKRPSGKPMFEADLFEY